jgi:hypothetical protein
MYSSEKIGVFFQHPEGSKKRKRDIPTYDIFRIFFGLF